MSAQAPEIQRMILDYVSSPPLEMPLRHGDFPGIMRITKLSISCKLCGGGTRHLRGSTTEHSACLEVRAAGTCLSCRSITWARVRIYPDHVLVWRDDDIVEHSLRAGPWAQMRSFLLRMILGR